MTRLIDGSFVAVLATGDHINGFSSFGSRESFKRFVADRLAGVEVASLLWAFGDEAHSYTGEEAAAFATAGPEIALTW